MRKIILLVGRSGSGKDTLAAELCKLGLKQVISYTTRKRRAGEGETHIFISKEESPNYPPENRAAETIINGEEYFTTVAQISECDVYIIDPRGIDYLAKKMPDINFGIVYMQTDDEMRAEWASKRVDGNEKDIEIYHQRTASEKDMFDQFELTLKSWDSVQSEYPSVQFVAIAHNSPDLDMKWLGKQIKELYDNNSSKQPWISHFS